MKAVSEGYTKFRAACFYASATMPFPSGKVRDVLSEFNSTIDIIVANDDTYSLHTLYQLFPFQPEGPAIE
jgi:cytidine deaminase